MKSCRTAFRCTHLVLKSLIFVIFFYLLPSIFNLPSSIFATSPASPNYQLNEWSIGGGGDKSESSNYGSLMINDPTAGEAANSSNYQLNPGLLFVEMANVPPAPTVTNPAEYYNKLHLVLNFGNNPTDSTFAVAISPDNFITTYYVKADNTIGPSLTSSDWRSGPSWGSTSGIDVTGLAPATTYTFKVKAEQGDFTETPWGPTASGLTDIPKLTFDIDVSATDTETASPYIVALGELVPSSVTTATDKIWTDFSTNANSGGVVFITGTNNGLTSSTSSHTIPGLNADLGSQSEGFGLITHNINQISGGPFTADNPFNGSGNTVGSTGITLIPLATSLTPLSGGRHSLDVKTIISALTPAGTDYQETLTIVAAATF